MLHSLIDDMLGALRLRFQPLAHYRYPWPLAAALITALGVFASARANMLVGPVEGRIAYFVLQAWLEMLLMGAFMAWWLKLGLAAWREVIGVLLATSLPLLLLPLASWAPDDVSAGLGVVAVVWTLILQYRGLALVSGISRMRVIGGLLLMTLPWLLGSALLANVALTLGWVAPPPELLEQLKALESSVPAETAPVPPPGPNDKAI